MEHHMHLFKTPFKMIQSGYKTVEVRLNDDKRRKLRPSDTIHFTVLPEEDQSVTVTVEKLETYPTFKDMYTSISGKELGNDRGETIAEMVRNTYDIYSGEQEEKWGAVAIYIRLAADSPDD